MVHRASTCSSSDDEPLCQMLVAAGARGRFSMHQMHGDLPLQSSAAQQ